MKFPDFFDRIYIVNLPYRQDRRQATIKELQMVGISLITDKIDFFPAIRPENKEPFLKLGSKGCFLSTIEILKQASAQGCRNILILQDDITLSSQFNSYETKILEKLSNTEWDIVQFGYFPERVCNPDDPNFCTFEDCDEPLIGAHCFAINGKSINRFLEFIEAMLKRPLGDPLGGPMPIDGAINTFKRQNADVVRLISIPVFASQRSSRSDVTPSKLDNIPILRSLLELLRKLGVIQSYKILMDLLTSSSKKKQ